MTLPDATNSGDRSRFSVKRRSDAVIHLLRGEDFELLSCEQGVTTTLSGWLDAFLVGGQAALKRRPAAVTTRSPGCGPRSVS